MTGAACAGWGGALCIGLHLLMPCRQGVGVVRACWQAYSSVLQDMRAHAEGHVILCALLAPHPPSGRWAPSRRARTQALSATGRTATLPSQASPATDAVRT